jgi:hypothetical protein
MLESIPALLLEIQEARNAFNLTSSTFLAERLVQVSPCEEHLNILAESYLQSRNFSQARGLLLNCSGPRSRYLLALACFKLDKLKEAEQVLTCPKKSGVEDFLGNAKDPLDISKSFGKLGKEYFNGISMGLPQGLMGQKPMANYSETFQGPVQNVDSDSGNSFLMSQKKSGTSQYLLNWTKKGLNTFTDFFGKKPKKKGEENKKTQDPKSATKPSPELSGRTNPRSLEHRFPRLDRFLRNGQSQEEGRLGQCCRRRRRLVSFRPNLPSVPCMIRRNSQEPEDRRGQ